ncbi:MAG: hypothetical protein ACD_57C00154G0001 [uncultured bacterium]|nr:MAG: hypothetical protein ACD_57C00154G0001 [uncultured bacterium]
MVAQRRTDKKIPAKLRLEIFEIYLAIDDPNRFRQIHEAYSSEKTQSFAIRSALRFFEISNSFDLGYTQITRLTQLSEHLRGLTYETFKRQLYGDFYLHKILSGKINYEEVLNYLKLLFRVEHPSMCEFTDALGTLFFQQEYDKRLNKQISEAITRLRQWKKVFKVASTSELM